MGSVCVYVYVYSYICVYMCVYVNKLRSTLSDQQ